MKMFLVLEQIFTKVKGTTDEVILIDTYNSLDKDTAHYTILVLQYLFYLRFFRLNRVIRYIIFVQDQIEESLISKTFQNSRSYIKGLLDFVQIFFGILICLHGVTCFWVINSDSTHIQFINA